MEIKGIAASKGIIAGKVVTANSPNEALRKYDLFKNDTPLLLVVSVTDPNWLIAMIKYDAIITDSGGVLSHAAIVSREFSIPCVVGTKNASQQLVDDMHIEVNADKGIITILEEN